MPANADSRASTVDQHRSFHCSTPFPTDEPSLRPELVSISTKNPFVVLNHHCVHANLKDMIAYISSHCPKSKATPRSGNSPSFSINEFTTTSMAPSFLSMLVCV